MLIGMPSPKGRCEDHMSWFRAITVPGMCDAQSLGGGCCSRKAGGGYMDHGVVCDAARCLISIPHSTCPRPTVPALRGGPQEGTYSSCCYTGHAAWQGKLGEGGSSPPLASWSGGLCADQLHPSPRRRGNPPSCSLTVCQELTASHPPTTATQPQLL